MKLEPIKGDSQQISDDTPMYNPQELTLTLEPQTKATHYFINKN